MKTSVTSLVSGILEGDSTQRLRGLLLEIYFQKTISPYIMDLTGAKGFSFGWLKGRVKKKQCFIKCLASGDICAIDKRFSQEMRAQGASVIFLRIVTSNGDLQGYVCDSIECSSEEAVLGSYVAKSATMFLQKKIIVGDVSSDLSMFFTVLSQDELLSIFSSRIIMNSYCIRGVTDLDAVYLSVDSRLVVVEFKRKYPAIWFRELKAIPRSNGDVGVLVAALENKNTSVLGVGYVKSNCFGLDLSHVKNYLFLSGANIEYIYMIYESYQKDPVALFDASFKGFGEIKVIFKKLSASDFIGACETSGDHLEVTGELRAQSGSWNHGLRYQLAILQSSFSGKFTIRN
ncbi:hypothetical protein ACW9H7_17990 [Pseudomonas yamanorum]